MKYQRLKLLSSLLILTLAGCNSDRSQVDTSNSQSPAQTSNTAATVVDLTQVGCQFLEVEAQNHQYAPQNAEDCEKINSETLAARAAEFKPLELKPGRYIFRVTNSNVDYPLGFYLRGKGIKKVSLPKVSGGGLTKGITKDYAIELVAGEYLFSCPLNPTPDYPIIVN